MFNFAYINFIIYIYSPMFRENQNIKSLIKPLRKFKQENVKNIFSNSSNNPEAFQPMELHHIVGQTIWKSTICGQMLSKTKMSRLKRDLSHNNQISMDQGLPSIKDDHYGMSTQKSNLTNFCLDQVDEQSRQRRTLQKFSQTRRIWKKNERSLLERVNKNQSISFNAVKNLYMHPNPDKLTLVNDNVPEYWKSSLRDNNKYLKKHLRGNPFKQQIAQEMMQTLGGRKRLEKSIPPIAQLCEQIALKGKNVVKKGESLKSNLKYLDQTLKSDYSSKDRWINEISCTQTLSSKFNFH